MSNTLMSTSTKPRSDQSHDSSNATPLFNPDELHKTLFILKEVVKISSVICHLLDYLSKTWYFLDYIAFVSANAVEESYMFVAYMAFVAIEATPAHIAYVSHKRSVSFLHSDKCVVYF
ncbi:hypothetical protein CDAR_270261 [Caerostris darwini]|uniref:Uncharacterized protein n=1 Tax=Caerostris darwini TaxID=1538125 RepID=A0AAV4NL55_9ARAC|nr:hypothetical protein CDAR_270261 [Caerostris darwini]